jgi:1-acyl-sn-glycerol-3-phosphate acyltransferase
MRRAGTRIRIIRLGLKLLFRALFRVRIEGRANVPATTPAIVCANHMGWTDAFLVLLFLPAEPRIYVLGEEQVKEISRARRFLIETLRVMVPLDRDKPLEALRTMKSVLSRGGSLLIFPEGHLGTEEGRLLPLQKGAAHLSLQSGAPVIPVGLTGTSRLWLRRHLTVRVGTPIHPDQFREGAVHDRLDNLTERLTAELQALLPGDNNRPKVRLLERWLTKLF